MTTTLTLTDAFNELLSRWTFLGFAATADSISASGLGIVDVSEFAHTGFGDEEIKDKYIDRYNLEGTDDEVKIATELVNTTGEVLHGGTAYSDKSDLSYRLLIVHPAIIKAAFASAQQKQYTTTHVLVTTYHDGDMERSNVNYWDGTSGGSSTSHATPTKATTYVQSGTQALKIAATAGTGHYVRGEQVWLTGGQSVYSCHQCLVETGTLTIRLYNATTSTYVSGNDVVLTGKGFVMAERKDTIATSGLYQIEYALTGASDVAWIDCTSGLRTQGRMHINLPDWMDESYKVRFIRPSLYEIPVPAATGGANVWDSDSRYFTGDWKQPQDFWLENFHSAAHPNAVNFNSPLPWVPVWIAAERQLSETEPLTTETGTTTVPMNQLMAYVQAELALALRALDSDNTFYQGLVKETVFEESIETLARPQLPQVQARGIKAIRV